MAVRHLTVKVTSYIDEAEAAEYILFTDQDFDEREKLCLKREKDAENIEALPASSDEEKARSKFLREQVKMSRRIMEHQREIRDQVIPYANVQTYTLKKPLWRKYTEAEEDSRTLHSDGEITTDKTKLMVALMPDALKDGMSAADIEEIEPCVIAYLWEKLYNALWPDSTRLNFLSLPSAKL